MTHDRADVIRQFPIFAGRPGEKALHYLDSAAMAQMPVSVAEAQALHDRTARANVHRGLYDLAERADHAYDAARAAVARHLHAASPAEVIFTGGTTAAINLLAQALSPTLRPGDEIVVSELDHHSNFLPWLRLAQTIGLTLKILPVDRLSGRLDLDALDRTVGNNCRLIALPHASNVTGAVTPVAPVVAAARRVGARLLLDGAQAVPHLPVNLQKSGADFYCFSGHKAFGPTGIGVLWGREDLLADLGPGPVGGGMLAMLDGQQTYFLPPPYRFEAGTPPVTQAVGLAAALTWLDDRDRKEELAHELSLVRRLFDGLENLPEVSLVGPADLDLRIPVVSFTVGQHHPHDICQILADQGVAVRGGALCAEPLMQALGLPGVVRASFAPYNDRHDVDALLDGLATAIKMLA